MNWIKMAVVGAALCAVSATAEAQGPPPGAGQRGQGMGGGRMQAMLFEGITLTAAQQDQLTALRAKAAKERAEHMPAGGMGGGMGGGAPDPAMRKMMMDMQAKSQAEIRAILTADQQVVFDRNVAAAKARREQRMAAPMSG